MNKDRRPTHCSSLRDDCKDGRIVTESNNGMLLVYVPSSLNHHLYWRLAATPYRSVIELGFCIITLNILCKSLQVCLTLVSQSDTILENFCRIFFSCLMIYCVSDLDGTGARHLNVWPAFPSLLHVQRYCDLTSTSCQKAIRGRVIRGQAS